jgi:hypothetical protein
MVLSRLLPPLTSIISRMAYWPLRRLAIWIVQYLQAFCHQVARALGVAAVAQGTGLQTKSSSPVNMSVNDVPSRDLSVSDQRWLQNKSC